MENSCQTLSGMGCRDHCTQTSSNHSSRQSSEYSNEFETSRETSNTSHQSHKQSTTNTRVNSYKSDILPDSKREIPSPIGHIQKEMSNGLNGKILADKTVQEQLLNRILDDEFKTSNDFKEFKSKKDKEFHTQTTYTQTETEYIYPEDRYQTTPRPPPCSKKELIPNMSVLNELDEHVLAIKYDPKTKLEGLVNLLVEPANNDLHKVRAFFTWICHNIA